MAPQSIVRTRAQNRSESVSTYIQPSKIVKDIDPKTLESLPDTFVLDPDTLLRKPQKKRRLESIQANQ